LWDDFWGKYVGIIQRFRQRGKFNERQEVSIVMMRESAEGFHENSVRGVIPRKPISFKGACGMIFGEST